MNVTLEEAVKVLKGDCSYLERVFEYYGVRFEHGKAKCIFHSDKTPSLGIKNGQYKCFSIECGANGDLLNLIQYKENVGFAEAVKKALEILNLPYTIQRDKLDNLREYIEKNFKEHYKYKEFKFDDVYFYKDMNNIPVLARIKYKDKNTGKKKFSQANIIEVEGNYYQLDFKSEKHNLIYNMPKVYKGIHENKNIFLVEGEKDADNVTNLGLIATSCREVNSASDILDSFENAKLIVIGDNDKTGREYINLLRKNLLDKVKSFKVLKMKEIIDLGEKADITDFIEAKKEEGLSNKDIKNIILDRVNRTLDEKNFYELQQDKNGIFRATLEENEYGIKEISSKRYLTNFQVISLNRVENIDTEEEIIELEIISDLGEKKVLRGRSNKIFLDTKSFTSFLNMGFVFNGKQKDLNDLKAWTNKYFLLEKRNEYLITGIRNIDNKRMLVTPNGSLQIDGTIDTNYKANNQLTLIDFSDVQRLTKNQAIELKKHLFSWNSSKNCYNIVGSLVSNMFNAIYRETKGINLHVTSLVGESGSGKSFTIDNIARPLLSLDNDTMVFNSIMPHGLLRAMNDTYMPTIIDEVKPSQAGEFKRQLLSNTIRSVTGESTVIKGRQDQSFKTYKYNSSLIIAGEEALDETALKNRCNIIWFSCSDMNDETLQHGNYFLSKEGRKALRSLSLEIYLEILKNWDSDKLLKTLESIANKYETNKIHPRLQATYNNTLFGCLIAKYILNTISSDKNGLESDKIISDIIYQNLKENVLDGEYASKQIYDEILEAIDELASGLHQYSISDGIHYKQDRTYLKLDIKGIYPMLESYYRSRGKTVKIDSKTFIKMLTKSKYVTGTSKEYYKVVNLDGKSKRCYFLEKEKMSNLEMPNLIPTLDNFDDIQDNRDQVVNKDNSQEKLF